MDGSTMLQPVQISTTSRWRGSPACSNINSYGFLFLITPAEMIEELGEINGFNIDQTGLCWEKTLGRLYQKKEQGNADTFLYQPE